MDTNQFDAAAKALGQDTSRRRMLAGLLGISLAGALGHEVVSALLLHTA